MKLKIKHQIDSKEVTAPSPKLGTADGMLLQSCIVALARATTAWGTTAIARWLVATTLRGRALLLILLTILHELDVLRDEAVEATLVAHERVGRTKTWQQSLHQGSIRLLFVGNRLACNEAEEQGAKSQQLDVVTVLQVLLHEESVTLQHGKHIARSSRRLSRNLLRHILGGEETVTHWVHCVNSLTLTNTHVDGFLNYFVTLTHNIYKLIMKHTSPSLRLSVSLSLNDDAKIQNSEAEIKRIHWRSPMVYQVRTTGSLFRFQSQENRIMGFIRSMVVRPLTLCSYEHSPYGRTFTTPMVVRPQV